VAEEIHEEHVTTTFEPAALKYKLEALTVESRISLTLYGTRDFVSVLMKNPPLAPILS
jgi:hypothetical protein